MLRIDKPSLLQAAFHTQAVSRHMESVNGETPMEPTLRAELFSAEQMEHYGVALAKQHKLSPRSSSDRHRRHKR